MNLSAQWQARQEISPIDGLGGLLWEQILTFEPVFPIGADMNSLMPKFAVAPMIDWTDRHCRYFHRLLSARATLYTEMIVDQAVIHGDAARLLDADANKRDVVLQLGGSEPETMARATRIGADFGYDEINLNCGCPSDRVQAGTFGAVLMREPDRVRAILEAMQTASHARISLKCRLGVDDQDLEQSLPVFLQSVAASGVRHVTIHARKAWLDGLSPKDNRTIPPLDYELALAMKAEFPSLEIALNGGLETLETAHAELDRGFDGVMLGRAAYQRPYDTISRVDQQFFGEDHSVVSREGVIEAMSKYLHEHVKNGGKVHQVTRHMMGLFHGQAGGRRWRQILTEEAKQNDPNILILALEDISARA